MGIRVKLWGNCSFPQNFHTSKLGEITVFFAVAIFENADNDLNNEANNDTSETESCLPSENERNKSSEAVRVISKPEFSI